MTSRLNSVKKISIDWTAIMPCPFCSNPGKLLASKPLSEPDSKWGASACVYCSTCGAGGPVIEPLENMLYTDMVNLAIKKWNKRGNLCDAENKLRKIANILNSNS
ncbi:Lar family restriction alleviation protein [Methylomonas sp. AM2-LC]|uniref:Lar family restriction alleviation protein n=1 Tax=Methylomonas sp. AM2-LC TaxID=3153301 RepID=UPI003267EBE0